VLRIVGILTGAALAIGALIIALGIPELTPPGEDAPTASQAPSVAEEKPLPEAAKPAEPKPTPAETSVAQVPEAAPSPPQEAMQEPATAAAPVMEENWYAFWSPFRSEIAAQGFVARLQETTGIDYRIVKIKTGVYEVTFAYVDEADIEDKLARISDATGLDMSGG
jgi:pyruvate/2-oxoglutarate dehydrogenase complex dihydrolipoamide acyltransferase (E2) component